KSRAFSWSSTNTLVMVILGMGLPLAAAAGGPGLVAAGSLASERGHEGVQPLARQPHLRFAGGQVQRLTPRRRRQQVSVVDGRVERGRAEQCREAGHLGVVAQGREA